MSRNNADRSFVDLPQGYAVTEEEIEYNRRFFNRMRAIHSNVDHNININDRATSLFQGNDNIVASDNASQCYVPSKELAFVKSRFMVHKSKPFCLRTTGYDRGNRFRFLLPIEEAFNIELTDATVFASSAFFNAVSDNPAVDCDVLFNHIFQICCEAFCVAPSSGQRLPVSSVRIPPVTGSLLPIHDAYAKFVEACYDQVAAIFKASLFQSVVIIQYYWIKFVETRNLIIDACEHCNDGNNVKVVCSLTHKNLQVKVEYLNDKTDVAKMLREKRMASNAVAQNNSNNPPTPTVSSSSSQIEPVAAPTAALPAVAQHQTINDVINAVILAQQESTNFFAQRDANDQITAAMYSSMPYVCHVPLSVLESPASGEAQRAADAAIADVNSTKKINSYILFCMDYRPAVINYLHSLYRRSTLVTRELGNLWNTCSFATRNRYQQLSASIVAAKRSVLVPSSPVANISRSAPSAPQRPAAVASNRNNPRVNEQDAGERQSLFVRQLNQASEEPQSDRSAKRVKIEACSNNNSNNVSRQAIKVYDQDDSRFDMPEECPVCCETDCFQVVLEPCKHWLCSACVSKLHNKKCPFCRVRFTTA